LGEYPDTLDDLLRDDRFVPCRRHPRKLFPNPYEPTDRWKVLSAPESGIRGVAAVVSDRGEFDYYLVHAPE
jgi:hypothetical protein